MFSSLERLHSIGKRAHYTLAWISPLLRYSGEPSHPSLARQTCVPTILWRTVVSPVPPDCVGTAAQAGPDHCRRSCPAKDSSAAFGNGHAFTGCEKTLLCD